MKRSLTLLALLLTTLPVATEAHQKSLSYSRWSFDGDRPAVELRMRTIELTRFPPPGPNATELARRLELRRGDTRCTPVGVTPGRARRPGWTVVRWKLDCPTGGPREIRSRLFENVLDSHVHFARITRTGGGVGERALVESDPVWPLDEPGGSPQPSVSFLSWIRLGAAHILAGWDHLAFVAALLLLAGHLREVTALVTGFTAGHSVTLALAALGIARPEPTGIEVLIGVSIALVGTENLWILAGRRRHVPAVAAGTCLVLAALAAAGIGTLPATGWAGVALFTVCHFRLLADASRQALLRGLVALAFGLVHGFGFAGVLAEAGLPTDRLVPALLGFNLGVEAGQLAVVLLAWPALAVVAAIRPAVHRLAVETGSASVVALGVFWLVTRTFAP